jgi:hypothetical protein
VRGGSLQAVSSLRLKAPLITSALEAYANYCIGIVLLGAAAARRLQAIPKPGEDKRHFQCEPFVGAIWRLVAIAQAGGITLDVSLGSRLLEGATVGEPSTPATEVMSEGNYPLKLNTFAPLTGFSLRARKVAADVVLEWHLTVVELMADNYSTARDPDFHYRYRRHGDAIESLLTYLKSLGLFTEQDWDDLVRFYGAGRELTEEIERSMRDGNRPPEVVWERLRHYLDRFVYSGGETEPMYHLQRRLYSLIEYRRGLPRERPASIARRRRDRPDSSKLEIR